MPNLSTIALKTFVPAKDFEVSKRFYQDVGFTLELLSEGLALFEHEKVGFLLQRYYVKEFAESLMLHLLVEDVDAWWVKLRDSGIAEKYSIEISAVEEQPWGLRDFTMYDPSGVLWRVAQK